MPAQANQPLPDGYQLNEYRILRVLASGGFSFVYLAHDDKETPVALKEFLPATLALRAAGAITPVVAPEHLATFRYGMRSFFEEGRALARLAHPNVVRVLSFFRANETVYMVMRYERGRTFQEHIQRRQGQLREDWLRRTFAALLTGLREVHLNKLLHLDIKPANIYLRNDGTPVLLDFGASRRTLTAEGIRLPPMYTPGFASPEHYGPRPGVPPPPPAGAASRARNPGSAPPSGSLSLPAGDPYREPKIELISPGPYELLGPWSDIYSIGASLYSALAATVPPPADQRLENDKLVPARKVGAGRYSAELLDIIDWCLRLDHLERPQSVFALQKALLGERPADLPGDADGSPAIVGHLGGQLKSVFRRLARRLS